LFGEPVATAGNHLGGVSLRTDGVDGELPIRAPVSRERDLHRFRLEGPQGAVTVTIQPGQDELTLKLAGRRAAAGAPLFLNVAIPVQLGGWYWVQGGEAQTMAVDRDYRVQPVDGKLPSVVLRNRSAELTLEAPTAVEAGYRAEDGRLWIRLALTDAAGVAEHTLRWTAKRRSPE
jgi:hypothetical protein